MHIHILGICGTFMGGIAAIARAAGHAVTGSDKGVYPPMSDQLKALGIELVDGFDPGQLDCDPDLVVVGNVMSRGMPIVEEMLNRGMPYTSGPAWLAEHVLKDRHVVAVSGTHGKTTTASMTAWLLEYAGLDPGFLIGGVPANFGTTARLGSGKHFVIEADEYDTAFFDKRAKFLHYGPRTLVINNLEFDHADIYKDMDAILWQFHQMLRILPGNGRLLINAGEKQIARLLDMGCWTKRESYSGRADIAADVHVGYVDGGLELQLANGDATACALALPGLHNCENAAAALLAARHAGVPLHLGMQGMQEFRGVKRRLELRGNIDNVRIYDDFAHHPTAIKRTLEAVRETSRGRVFAVIEPRSNSMKLGAHRAALADSLQSADRVWAFQPRDLPWSLRDELAGLNECVVADDVDTLAADICVAVKPGDDVVVMSNGAFGGIHDKLCTLLADHRA